MHNQYKCDAIRELRDQQVRFAPRDKKLEQLDRAEALLRDIDAAKTYNYEYVCYRITTFRPEKSSMMPIKGSDLRLSLIHISEPTRPY